MKRTKIKLIIAGLLVLSLLAMPLMGACAPKPAPAPAPAPAKASVKIIGNLQALTGPAAATLGVCGAGVADYARYVNEVKGGIKGKKGWVKMEVITADTRYQVPLAKEAFAKLKDRGMIAVTQCASGIADALMNDYEAAKIPNMAMSIGIKSAWSDWCYTNSHSGVVNTVLTWEKWIKSRWDKEGKTGKLKAGAIGVDSPFAVMILSKAPGFAKELGIEWTQEIHPIGATDVSAQLLKLRDAGVEYIYGVGMGPQNAMYYRQIKELNLPMEFTACPSGPLADMVSVAGAEAMEGAIAETLFLGFLKDPGTPDSEGLILCREIWDKYHPGAAPLDFFINGAMCTMVIEEAIRLALDDVTPEELDGAALKKYGFDRIKDFDCMGFTAPFSYTPGTFHNGPGMTSYAVLEGGYIRPITGWIESTKYRVPLKK